jgi:hypothetical protein
MQREAKAKEDKAKATMPARFLPRLVPCLPARLLAVAALLALLALPGCMGRWELGDVGGLPYPRAKAQPRSECATGGPVSCSEQPRAGGMLPPGTSR